MKLSNSLYDILKWICVIFVPALITYLNILLPSLGVDASSVSTVITIIGAAGTFIGALIGISTANYYKDEAKNDK